MKLMIPIWIAVFCFSHSGYFALVCIFFSCFRKVKDSAITYISEVNVCFFLSSFVHVAMRTENVFERRGVGPAMLIT